MNDTMRTETSSTVPPAIFPTLFGLAGLGTAWLKSGVADWLGWAVLIATAGAYIWALAIWAWTGVRRVPVWLGSVPGRLGLSAIGLTGMLFAAALSGPAPGLAGGLVAVALLMHFGLAVAVLPHLRAGGALRGQVTPVWHLMFVGFIVGAQATAQIEQNVLTLTLFAVTFCLALGIYGLSVERAREAPLPPQMRPLTVVHLAPVSLFASVSMLMNLPTLAVLFAAVAVALAGFLLVRVRWMTEAGFGPSWVAFTFPSTAFAAALLMVGEHIGLLWWLGFAALLACSVLVPIVAGRMMQRWKAGQLPIPE